MPPFATGVKQWHLAATLAERGTLRDHRCHRWHAQPPSDQQAKAEKLLLSAVDDSDYESIAAFCRDVAKRTKLSEETEESAFYRIVRKGAFSAKARRRLRIYAELLKDPQAAWITSPDRPRAEPAWEKQVRKDLQDLKRRVSFLADQVEQLKRQFPPAAGVDT